MKKILIVGASSLQLPAIVKAKQMGFYVGVIDYDSEAVGIKYADVFFNCSTIDENGVTNVAKQFLPDGIITLATDAPMRSVAKACETLGLPGISYETALKATDKGRMIKEFELKHISHPWFYIISDKIKINEIKDELEFPCIIKPSDSSGSRGVLMCETLEELIEGYDYSVNNSRSGTVIIEEYLDGPEFSVEIMVVEGVPHVLQITDKITTGSPFFVELAHSQPSEYPNEIQNDITKLACSAVIALGIHQGPAHVEIILTDKGPKMVELGARMGGDYITTHLVPLSTGIDMVEAVINIACSKKPNITKLFNKASAIMYFNSYEGHIKSISGTEDAKKVKGVREIKLLKMIGEYTGSIKSSSDRIGFVISQAENPSKAREICSSAINKINILIE